MKTVPLRFAITLPFIVLAIVAGLTTYVMAKYTIESVAEKIGKQYTSEVENRIVGHITHATHVLPSLVEINRAAIKRHSANMGDLTLFAERFREQSLPYPQLTFVSMATADGRYIAASRDPHKSDSINIAANFFEEKGLLTGYYYDDNTIVGERTDEPQYPNYDPRKRPFYLDAVKKNGLVWSPIHPYVGYISLGIGMSAPVYDDNGNLIAVTAASMALNELDDFLADIELVESGFTFIAEKSGALIATSSNDELFTINKDKSMVRLTLSDHKIPALQHAGKLLQSGQHKLDVNGETYLYHVSEIKHKYGETWYVGVIIPKAHHHQVLKDYSMAITVITFLLFLSIGIVGSMLAWHIGQPIRQLEKAAHNNDLNAISQLPQPLSAIREVDSLGQGMREMADSLTNVLANLEKKVAERTSNLKDENLDLQQKSITDELTKLLNRRGFNQKLTQLLQQAEAKRSCLTFILCDVDYFKQVNDRFGHIVGDKVLTELAEVLRHATAQDNAVLARYGGEEFAVVLPDYALEQSLEVIHRIQEALSKQTFGEGSAITFSFGVNTVGPITYLTTERLITSADSKLYQAKKTGRNRIVC
ncbi:diguanylate cyclase [Vibrio sonorensis]|uniref:diguanylate cyclase n=1 Tax=Vibrio sonorensis TaxID=1004316 RepID=UPI0008DA2673|nr:diguanylate cyclase [Vibrio sonorensis]